MEQRITEFISSEIKALAQLETRDSLAIVSRLYDIPLERLVKDTMRVNPAACKGILKTKERCLKKPRENGYCGFHQKQAPGYTPPEKEHPSAPWE